MKFTFTDKEEETIFDPAATLTEIDDDVETGVRLTRDIGIGEQLIYRAKHVPKYKVCSKFEVLLYIN